jgi:hypothetical protein
VKVAGMLRTVVLSPGGDFFRAHLVSEPGVAARTLSGGDWQATLAAYAVTSLALDAVLVDWREVPLERFAERELLLHVALPDGTARVGDETVPFTPEVLHATGFRFVALDMYAAAAMAAGAAVTPIGPADLPGASVATPPAPAPEAASGRDRPDTHAAEAAAASAPAPIPHPVNGVELLILRVTRPDRWQSAAAIAAAIGWEPQPVAKTLSGSGRLRRRGLVEARGSGRSARYRRTTRGDAQLAELDDDHRRRYAAMLQRFGGPDGPDAVFDIITDGAQPNLTTFRVGFHNGGSVPVQARSASIAQLAGLGALIALGSAPRHAGYASSCLDWYVASVVEEPSYQVTFDDGGVVTVYAPSRAEAARRATAWRDAAQPGHADACRLGGIATIDGPPDPVPATGSDPDSAQRHQPRVAPAAPAHDGERVESAATVEHSTIDQQRGELRRHLQDLHPTATADGSEATTQPTPDDQAVALGMLRERHEALHLEINRAALRRQWIPGMHEHRDRGHALRYDELPEPGTRVFLADERMFIDPETLRGRCVGTVAGVEVDAIELVFGDGGVERLRVVIDLDSGDRASLHPQVVQRLEVAARNWRALNQEGLLVAGGPRLTEQRARELAAEHHGRAVRGLPWPTTEAPTPLLVRQR